MPPVEDGEGMTDEKPIQLHATPIDEFEVLLKMMFFLIP
jgi:hypothetical protein